MVFKLSKRTFWLLGYSYCSTLESIYIHIDLPYILSYVFIPIFWIYRKTSWMCKWIRIGAGSDVLSHQVQASGSGPPHLSNRLCQGKAELLSLPQQSHNSAGAYHQLLSEVPGQWCHCLNNHALEAGSQGKAIARLAAEDWVRQAALIPICCDNHDDQSNSKLLFSKCEHNSRSLTDVLLGQNIGAGLSVMDMITFVPSSH